MTFKKTNSMIIEQEEEIDSNHFPSKAHIH